jgi:hypothetical protein
MDPVTITITQKQLTLVFNALCCYSANTLVPHEPELAMELAHQLQPFSTDIPEE